MATATETLLRLDLGCGRCPKDGYHGVDAIAFPEVGTVVDLRQEWPWPDNSVEEVWCSHTLEHFERHERVHFFNELYRVLAVGGVAIITVPDWSHDRAYGDPTHCWPPVSRFAWQYLNREWRKENAPHVDTEWNSGQYCFRSELDFETTYTYLTSPEVALRSKEAKEWAVKHYINTAIDMVATLTKRVVEYADT